MTIENRYYGNEADNYDERRRHTRTRTAEDAAFDHLLGRAVGKASIGNVLDVPCGTGRWINRFRNAGIAYTGLDISSDMLRHAELEAARLNTSVQLTQGSCFTYLPEHADEFDLVVSTRFINWWDEATGRKLVTLLCRASRRFALLHVRVDENRVQRLFGEALRWPNRIRKAIKSSEHRRRELSRASTIMHGGSVSPHFYISYHGRAALTQAVHDAGAAIAETIVLRRHAYGTVEFWLTERCAG